MDDADLDRAACTIEEREEYEPYVNQGLVIFAGVDYEAILRAAEAEAKRKAVVIMAPTSSRPCRWLKKKAASF